MGNKIILIFALSVFLISFAYAEVSYCCEKTVVQNDGSGGAWCQNSPTENCDSNFRKVPSSCEATSYCKKGTCYDSQEGTCSPNTAQKSCEDAGGVWAEGKPEELPQCQLGCCLIGDQASFVTQTRCKRLSSLYGLEINFKTNIKSEIQCIASATSDAKGACVFEKEFEKTCLTMAKKECLTLQANSETEVKFYEEYLCSDESLGTNCGPTEQTTCVEGKDGVYFIDSCGNIANIYDASKIKDKTYWSKIIDEAESCGADDSDGNAGSAICGNCDYYLGSTCKTSGVGDSNPKYGNNICKDLDCVYDGERYKHGETWCADAKGVDDSLPGSRHYRMVCYNGEVSTESCADFRQEVCLQSDIDGFKTAACRVNRWQDCYSQNNEKDCDNDDKRDCQWIKTTWEPKAGDTPGIINSTSGGVCLPDYAPGLEFWNPEGEAESLCSIGTTKCTVVFEKDLFGNSDCIKNCECLKTNWKSQMENICSSIGDCGSTTNYFGFEGYN